MSLRVLVTTVLYISYLFASFLCCCDIHLVRTSQFALFALSFCSISLLLYKTLLWTSTMCHAPALVFPAPPPCPAVTPPYPSIIPIGQNLPWSSSPPPFYPLPCPFHPRPHVFHPRWALATGAHPPAALASLLSVSFALASNPLSDTLALTLDILAPPGINAHIPLSSPTMPPHDRTPQSLPPCSCSVNGSRSLGRCKKLFLILGEKERGRGGQEHIREAKLI